MKKQEIGELSCKIISIYILISGIAISEGAWLSLISLQAIAREGARHFAPVVLFFPSLLLFCLSACFWLYADDIARRMFQGQPELSDTSIGVKPNSETLPHIAFVIAGIMILNGALSALINPISSVLQAPRQLTMHSRVSLVIVLIRIVIGTWLILGTPKLRSVSARLQSAAKNEM